MTGATYRAVGVRDAQVVAVSTEPDGLDDLLGTATIAVDAGNLTLLPAFDDAHEHLMEAGRNTMRVPVDGAHSVTEFLAMVHEAAASAAPGAWIITSMGWHESNLAENRMPTGAELDEAAGDHPVLARRGGHLAVVNSAALAAAGIGAESPDPPGGAIDRLGDGRPSGLLEGGAVYQVAAFAPPATQNELVEGLRRASSAYAALGVGTIREAMITVDELAAYQDAAERRVLSVRARPLIRVGAELSADDALSLIHGIGGHSGFGDDWVRVWGLKFVMDGGVEGAALEQPYANNPSNSGHLNWDPDAMTQVCTDAVQRGWRIGTHAAGDRAVRTILDVYERVIDKVGELPPWTLVVEHALLSDPAQRTRAVKAGIGITVQHALLWNMASEMITTWGPERTEQVNPIDEWLSGGASLAAGTDLARPLNPMTNVWGMATRGTKTAGIRGPQHRIPLRTALELYTIGSAALNGESDRRGTVAPGKLADLVAYRLDPLTAEVDELADLTPSFTLIGGRPTYDPDGMLG
jgi:predicted amidohydrolase YtcJ